MLRSVNSLEKCSIGATDGDIGSVKDIYFDDQQWVVRYLVVDAGNWLSNRKVLISPLFLPGWEWDGDAIPATLTREQVKSSPVVDTDRPVSRQYERSFYGYYGYPHYWGGMGLWEENPYPSQMTPRLRLEGQESEENQLRREHQDHHLRSCNLVRGYHLHASDGDIGHVDGYLIDEQSWAIRFLVVNTSNWWVGHHVLVASEWINSVSWTQSSITTALTRDAVQESPRYDPSILLDASGEAAIYKHYGRSQYGQKKTKAA